MSVNIGNDWDDFFAEETVKDYYIELRGFLKAEYGSRAIYPPMNDIFNAFRLTALKDVKAVILGQDPYINAGEAHGLAFSVRGGVRTPPSLSNIFKELNADMGVPMPTSGCLERWARNGVMMLNACLTVRAGSSKSHAGRGWERLTDAAISAINRKTAPVVFMLWGRDAQKKAPLVTNPNHLVLTAAHPSPLAGGAFGGCRHFSKANAFLTEHGIEAIDWKL